VLVSQSSRKQAPRGDWPLGSAESGRSGASGPVAAGTALWRCQGPPFVSDHTGQKSTERSLTQMHACTTCSVAHHANKEMNNANTHAWTSLTRRCFAGEVVALFHDG
jgi:hypothetical protein